MFKLNLNRLLQLLLLRLCYLYSYLINIIFQFIIIDINNIDRMQYFTLKGFWGFGEIGRAHV